MLARTAVSATPTNAEGDAAVVIDRVQKHFGKVRALRGLSARIEYGKLTGLVGPDGAGKTTLMRILTGLLVPDAGRATLAGFDVVRDNDAIHVASGYMPQRFGLYEDLSVMENMRLYAQLRGMDIARHERLFSELLEFTRLGPFTERLAGKLSGGMKQKLGLACALMARPAVRALDEPGVGVDPVSRQDLWRMVQALTDEGMAWSGPPLISTRPSAATACCCSTKVNSLSTGRRTISPGASKAAASGSKTSAKSAVQCSPRRSTCRASATA